MHHGEAVKMEKDNAAGRKAKVGLILFFVYSVIYAGFVIINTLSPETMSTKPFFNLNLAVIYGFGLIVLAIVMGVLYNHYCTKLENRVNTNHSEKEEGDE
jgi:uncharacterized membrane protein (DUF485 family)